MGQFSMEISGSAGSLLSENQQSDPSVGVFLVLAKKDVDAGPYDLRECLAYLPKLISPERYGLNSRHGDLGDPNPVRIAFQ